MATITDERMRELLPTAKTYTAMVLKAGPNRHMDGVEKIIWGHARVCGLAIFDLDPAETAEVMDEDPGVQAGVFVYEVHPCRSFPGDTLPA
jgi:hypothetical protein